MVLVPPDYNSFKIQPRYFTYFHWTISLMIMIDENQNRFGFIFTEINTQFIIQKPIKNIREIFS